MKKVILGFVIVGAASMLIGCQGTSNSSTAASTTGTCVYNSSTGYSVNSVTGAVCSTTTTSGLTGCVMTSAGYYINTATGAICSATSTTTGYSGYPTYYGNTTAASYGYSSNICAQYYGYGWTLTYLNGQPMCVSSSYY